MKLFLTILITVVIMGWAGYAFWKLHQSFKLFDEPSDDDKTYLV